MVSVEDQHGFPLLDDDRTLIDTAIGPCDGFQGQVEVLGEKPVRPYPFGEAVVVALIRQVQILDAILDTA